MKIIFAIVAFFAIAITNSVLAEKYGSDQGYRRQTRLPRRLQSVGRACGIRGDAAAGVSLRVGGLRQTSIRRNRTRASLSRLLHAPRGDLQSPSGGAGGQGGGVPVARLCTSQQEAAATAGAG